jgi:hypothetical protein
MGKKFRYLANLKNNSEEENIESLLGLLCALDESFIFDENEYNTVDLRYDILFLVKWLRSSLGYWVDAKFEINPEYEIMDSDNNFVLTSTYVATAVLSKVLCEYPLLALSIKGYNSSLEKGLKYCSYCNLQWYGYEKDIKVIDALITLGIGKIPWLLNRHPDFCPALKNKIDRIADDMGHIFAYDSAVNAWGKDYSAGFLTALETLRLQNDHEFMESMKVAKNNDETIGIELFMR